MSTVSFSPLLGVADPAAIQRSLRSGPDASPAKGASQQFEAILVRQLLGEAMKPMLGSAESDAPGRDIYQYMVTDIVSQSVAQGGGLGIAKMLESQLAPKSSTHSQEAAS